MKKNLTWALALCMVLAMTGCAGTDKKETTAAPTTAAATTEAAKETTAAAAETTEAAKETTAAAAETTEAAKETTEAAAETTEAAKETTEAAAETTESAKETTEAAAETTEAAKETTEAAAETTEAAEEAETVEAVGETAEAAEETTEAGEEAAEAVLMSYAEFVAAELDTPVKVETYVQAKQSWWENKATVYTQNEDGAFFIYEMACSEEDYEKLVPGQKIVVTGYKAEWSGEVEIVDATFELEEADPFVAEAVDVTDLLGKDELAEHQNQFVTFTGMTVEAAAADQPEAAYLYKWDGSGAEGDDLYFNVSKDGATYTFTVESYLCGADTDVYKAVKELKVGDTVDMEGFLYWYEGPNPHITSVTVK